MLRKLMHTAYNYKEGPFAFRYPRGSVQEQTTSLQAENTVQIGKGAILREGNDVALLAVGPMVKNALDAAEILSEKGVSVAVYDMIFVKPVDTDIIDGLSKKCMPIITVEDGTTVGGLGSAVADRLVETGSKSKMTKIGIPDNFVTHGTIAQLQTLCGMDAQSIADKALELIESVNPLEQKTESRADGKTPLKAIDNFEHSNTAI